MVRLVLGVVAVSALLMGAAAAGCYEKAEIEAEQGLRIHSELMVISLNCQHMSHKRGNLYILYREFTRKHQSLLSDYERRLISFYQRQGVRDPEAKLHEIRTDLAKDVAQDAARMRPDIFCRSYSDRIPEAMALDTRQVRQWAGTPFPGQQLSQPVCASASGGYNKG